jgi:signal transduction histidine kinase
MNASEGAVDFRPYRPTAVLLIDLVRHSKRDKAAVSQIQGILEEVLKKSLEALNLSDSQVHYTGDGYVCSLFGEDSTRILDLINAAMPDLVKRLAPHGQEFRAGLDYGLVHLRPNMLTGDREHFDLPGIQAARLEHAACPGQILCTETVHALFHHHYPAMFLSQAKSVKAKDRRLRAYELTPMDYGALRTFFSQYFFGLTGETPHRGTRKDILLVDDEPTIRTLFATSFADLFPSSHVVTAANGKEAIALFEPGRFWVVVTDLMMPVMSGIDLTRELLGRDRDQPIVMLTGYASPDVVRQFYSEGGHVFLTKPVADDELRRSMELASMLASLQTTLTVLSDDRAQLLERMREVADRLGRIQHRVGDARDPAHTLLRHKAKHIALDIVTGIQPGSELVPLLAGAATQLTCVERLARFVGRADVPEIEDYTAVFVSDLRQLHPGVEISLHGTLKGPESDAATLPAGTVVMLIICELIDNAVDAVEPVGTIALSLSRVASRDQLQIVVRDSGPGIAPDILARAFDEGVSTKGSGRGLGLSVVRQAVHILGGEISYKSDGGSTFTVSLPYERGAPSTPVS